MRNRKWNKIFIMVFLISAFSAGIAYAGSWLQGTGENAGRWWYEEEDGSYPYGKITRAKAVIPLI